MSEGNRSNPGVARRAKSIRGEVAPVRTVNDTQREKKVAKKKGRFGENKAQQANYASMKHMKHMYEAHV